MALKKLVVFLSLFFYSTGLILAQETQIKGFASTSVNSTNGKSSFGFDEQDLFITSQATSHISFLGETVFKYTPTTPTEFSVSIERILMKYNYYGNHSIIIGKHHTPLNYWNDTYHHGRVFFPTIARPILFDANLLPLHTSGINFQGQNLGDYKFGYDVLIGNGLGASDITDNDNFKSLAFSLHFSPIEKMRIGASFYTDRIAKGADVHGFTTPTKFAIKQNVLTGSLAYFGEKFELLAESSLVNNTSDTTGTKKTLGSYIYGGVRVSPKIIPYLRYDNITYESGEVYFTKNNLNSMLLGIRYEINYLATVKFEYQHIKTETIPNTDKLTIQFALGF